MLGLLGFIGGVLALVWTVTVASVGLALLFAMLLPVLILALFFRIGFALIKVAAIFVLFCFVAAWLV